MESFKTLIKFNLKYFLFPRFSTKKERNKFIILMSIVALCFIVPLVEGVILIYYMASNAAQQNSLPSMMSSIFLFTQIAIIFLGSITYLQIMYLSNDNDFLSTLPVTSTQRFIAKLITVIAMEGLISLIAVLPTSITTIVALIKSGISVCCQFYILIPIAIITLPIIPILVIAIVSFPIMKLLSYMKKHPTLGAILTVFIIVFLLLAIYLPLYSTIYSEDSNIQDNELVLDNEEIQEEEMISGLSIGLVNSIAKIGKYYYPALCLAKAMFGENSMINILIYFAINIAIGALGVLLASKLYESSATALTDNAGIRQKTKTNEDYKENSASKSLLIREFKTITRDTQKLINVLLAVIMAPLMSFIMMFVFKQAMAADPESEGAISSLIMVAFCSMFTIIMIGGSNVGASAGYSLEGKQFYLLKTLPVSYEELFKSKLKLMDLADIVGIIAADLVLVIMSKCNVLDFFAFLLICPIYTMSVNAFALYRDLKNVKLEWSNIKEVTKNNFATMIPLAILLPQAIISLVLGFALDIVLNINPYAKSAIYWLVMLLIGIAYYFILRKGVIYKVANKFEEVEC